MLELLPYMTSPFPEMMMGEIEVPDDQLVFLYLNESEVRNLLSDSEKSRKLGSGWLESQGSVALAVPSIHLHSSRWRIEPNVLINPLHPEFEIVKLLSTFNFKYDNRLEK